MGKKVEQIFPETIEFIEKQKIFFVATAMSVGTVNVSPKGMDTFRVISPNRVMWLNVTGSGNETATHLQENDRITIMFCAFDGKPLILRLYGKGKVYHQRDKEWTEYINLFPKLDGTRQIIDIDVQIVQTSCGMAVPFMDFKQEREELKTWAKKQGEEGLKEYWDKKNTISFDGHPTGIFE
ncbi:pyridoxamine 5'-phosphate oxidase family protein [Emticicia sp.]|uniref:pyridoxamine 5'-phosphate oxidase family protein n=1 Tax=Emticicia sp. TaxID=1930953 RepID=UPI003750045A